MANKFEVLAGLVDENDKSFIVKEKVNTTKKVLPKFPVDFSKRIQGREWLRSGNVFVDRGSLFEFRIASYNVLAPSYAKKKHFPICNPDLLHWNKRRIILLETIAALDADILCLQEIEFFESFWRSSLAQLGYRGIFKKRSGASKADGCAIFYRKSRFTLVDHRGIDLDRVARPPAGTARPTFATHNVALLAVLSPIVAASSSDLENTTVIPPFSQDGDARILLPSATPPQRLVVANAHLFWDPAYEELKLAQARATMLAAEAIARETAAGDGATAVLLAGDFNALPDSLAYEFVTRAGYTSAYSTVAAAAAAASAATAAALAHAQYIPSPRTPPLSPPPAACGSLEPPFTNFRDSFRGTLDYIFLGGVHGGGGGGGLGGEAGLLGVRAVLWPPDQEEVAAEGGGLPSSRHASDHVPLAADVAWRAGAAAAVAASRGPDE